MSFEDTLLEKLAAPIKNAIVGGPFGSNLVSKDYVVEGVPVIRGQNMGNKFVSGPFVFVSADKAEKLAQNKARPGDLVFTQRGTLGQISIVPDGPYEEYIVSQSQMKITLDPEKADINFIYYLFKSEEQLRYILNSSIQTGVPHTNLGILRKTPVRIPALSVQRVVGSLLTMLDNRIALLRETNSTLEAIAQALFKSWFVDFDPVHANAAFLENGQAPSLPAEIQALFPSRLVESPQGLIPEGWSWKRLDEAYEINPKRQLKKGVVAKYLDMASVQTQGHVTADVNAREFGSGTKFCNGDTLLARITPCLENGKTAFVDFLENDEIGWGSTEFVVLRPKAPLPEFHGYLLARQPLFREFAIRSMSGTSGRQRVQNDVLGSFNLALPDEKVANAFNQIVTPIQQGISANHKQAQTVANLRDTLLPRLISGQLRLPEAEEALAEMG